MKPMTSDIARFLLKVLVVSLGVSLLIKLGGPMLPMQGLEGRSLNQLAIFLILLPSTVMGSFLLIKSRS